MIYRKRNEKVNVKNEKKPDLHVVSFSGGKDSTAMVLHMIELGMKIDIVLYCDTGMDFPAMYTHVEKIKNVIEELGIKFVTLKNPQSFKYLMLDHPTERRPSTIEKLGGNPIGYSWPANRYRWCTLKLKTELLKKYKKELNAEFNIIEYVGLAADEQYRLERESNKRHKHPLVNWGWDEAKALAYCYEKGYDWEGLYKHFSRVSCWCCPLQSFAELRNLRKFYPELWDELKDMDSKTWRKFRPDYSVEELEVRFELEEERLSQGLTISGHSKEFREALKESISLAMLHKK